MAIKYDSRNYRKHNERNKKLIKKSLQDCGAGRSIVIDNEDNIIAGNGIYEQAQALDMPIKVVETDGSELVVVKRTDLATDDDKRKQLAVMDNSTSDSSEFDLNLLQTDFSVDDLSEFGVDVKIKEAEEKPEVQFTEELLEKHNYLVLFFDNEVDWLQAESLFDLQKVKILDSKENWQRVGVGRVINGAKALKRILESNKDVG